MSDRLVVLVNGLPGSGKTTLAWELAGCLNLPLISKDVIKEANADVLGTESAGLSQRQWNHAIGAAASETMWALLACSPAGAVLESFWPMDSREFVVRGLSRAGDPLAIEIWCEVPFETAKSRYEERHPRHAIHGHLPTEQEWEDWRTRSKPLKVGPVLHVDTTHKVDIQAALDWIRATEPQLCSPNNGRE